MSITTILDLHFKPESVAEGLELFRRVLVDTRAFDGCESVTVVQDHADPAHVILIERWASLEHDTTYRAWRAGEGRNVGLPPLLAGAPTTSVCETTDV